jgi:hypothetical protein
MKNMPNNQIITDVYHPPSSSEMDSIAVIRSVATEGFRSGWNPGRKSSTKATVARDRATLMEEIEQVVVVSDNKQDIP